MKNPLAIPILINSETTLLLISNAICKQHYFYLEDCTIQS